MATMATASANPANEDFTQDMGTHLYDSFHSLERILEGNQETRKEVLTMFGGYVQFNGCNR